MDCKGVSCNALPLSTMMQLRDAALQGLRTSFTSCNSRDAFPCLANPGVRYLGFAVALKLTTAIRLLKWMLTTVGPCERRSKDEFACI